MAIGAEFLLRERLGMMPMRVQGQQHGCTFLHNTDASVRSPVNSTLVPFGQTKPSLQIQVVARQIGPTTAREQPQLETRHDTPHLLANRIFVCQQFVLNRAIEPFALRPAIGSGVQGGVDSANRLDIRRYLFLRFHHQASAFVDATDQPLQQQLCLPLFLRRTLRRSDCCTSPSASDIRTPGGRKGPP